MKNFQTYQVFPNIPLNLEFLEELSRNLWWCWVKDAIELFRRIDPVLWVACERNPIAFLAKISQYRFEQLAADEGYLSHLERVKKEFQNRVLDPVDQDENPYGPDDIIAYFSMEFGIHESLPLFAGGLGILAGDHLKAASNLGLPLVGIGLMYHHGYFRQFLNPDGWQQEAYPETDLYSLPAERRQHGCPSRNYVESVCRRWQDTAGPGNPFGHRWHAGPRRSGNYAQGPAYE